jgi:twitching motility protein PilT
VSSHKIDKFIEALHKKTADHLLFGTNTPVRISKGGAERVILDKPVRTDQLVKLLQPIVGDTTPLERDGEKEFFYESPTGRVHLRTMRTGERMTAIITPDHGGNGAVMHLQEVSHDDDAPLDIMGNLAPQPMREPTPAPPPPPQKRGKSRQSQDLKVQAADPGHRGAAKIDAILRVLVQNGGSDLHLTASHTPRMRKDGDIMGVPGWGQPLSGDTIYEWMGEVAHEAARNSFNTKNDADFAYEIEGVARFRMNWFRDRNGPGAVMRQIPSKVLTAEQLGLPRVILNFCGLPKGLVVVTGPTGSGKSTTLAAMVDFINKTRSDHIITIEDPVEFVHQSQKCLVNQREVHMHTQSFSAALRAALREDPDIVLVGEMRDLETVGIAIETAETGHLVFGTLHTNTAMSTVDRIIDQFPTDQQAQIRVMLSESLKGVVAQTLCKKIGGGRVACLEILVVNPAVSNLIREAKTFQIASMMQTGKGIGMQTQTDHMMELVKQRIVAPQEAVNKAIDQNQMKSALERAGFKLGEA